MNISSSQGFWSHLRRIPRRGWVGGVCAGFADYFDWNVRLIRALVVAATLFVLGPMAFVAYAVLWYVMEPGRIGDARRSEAPSGSGGAHANASPNGSAPRTDVRERFCRLEQRLAALEECVTTEEFELRQEFRKLGA